MRTSPPEAWIKDREETLELLTSCAEKFGQTLVIVPHDPEVAAKADHVIHIKDGRVVSTEDKGV